MMPPLIATVALAHLIDCCLKLIDLQPESLVFSLETKPLFIAAHRFRSMSRMRTSYSSRGAVGGQRSTLRSRVLLKSTLRRLSRARVFSSPSVLTEHESGIFPGSIEWPSGQGIFNGIPAFPVFRLWESFLVGGEAFFRAPSEKSVWNT